MTTITTLLPAVLNSTANNFISKGYEWGHHIVTKIKAGAVYLEDPRIASATVFLLNFGILELAMRISQLTEICLPRAIVTRRYLKSAIGWILTGSLALGGNIALIRASGIALSPFVITAIVTTTLIVKYNLESYLDSQSTAEKSVKFIDSSHAD